jgi:putative tricarboxylic transport membrane protein
MIDLRTVPGVSRIALAAGLALTLPTLAQAERAPEGPIEISVGCSAGCTPDVLMRRAASIWNAAGIITNPIVVVNREGGGMTAAMNYVLSRPGDENNLMALAEPVFSTPLVQGTDPLYDDFVPLGVFVQTQLIVLAQPDHAATNLAEMVEIARANPQRVMMAGSSAGGTDEQVLGLIAQAAGDDVEMTFIPHSGGGAAQTTFLGGNTDMVTVTINEALPHIEAGNARPIAILIRERRQEPALADIPTAIEQGIDVTWGQVFGLLGAPELDPEVRDWWSARITELTETEEWQAFIAENYLGGDVYVGEGLPAAMDRFHEDRVAVLRLIGAIE